MISYNIAEAIRMIITSTSVFSFGKKNSFMFVTSIANDESSKIKWHASDFVAFFINIILMEHFSISSNIERAKAERQSTCSIFHSFRIVSDFVTKRRRTQKKMAIVCTLGNDSATEKKKQKKCNDKEENFCTATFVLIMLTGQNG